MSDNKQSILFFEKQPFAVRLTAQEVSFIKENYDDLFDADEGIQPRNAFMLLAEKALLKVSKLNKSLPDDLQQIESLKAQLTESQKELEGLTVKFKEVQSALNSAVELKDSFERKYNEKMGELENVSGKLENSENTKVSIKTTDRLLNLSPFESFVLAQIEHVHQTDAKGILIDRFFNIYQKRGNGDYDIKRISPMKMTEIENHFKANNE